MVRVTFLLSIIPEKVLQTAIEKKLLPLKMVMLVIGNAYATNAQLLIISHQNMK